MHAWQVQDAKARFSELLRSVTREGPQAITVRGRTAAVVISQEDYERLRGRKPSLTEFMRTSPLAGAGIEVERDGSLPRDADL